MIHNISIVLEPRSLPAPLAWDLPRRPLLTAAVCELCQLPFAHRVAAKHCEPPGRHMPPPASAFMPTRGSRFALVSRYPYRKVIGSFSPHVCKRRRTAACVGCWGFGNWHAVVCEAVLPLTLICGVRLQTSVSERFKTTASAVCPHTLSASGSPASAQGASEVFFCRAKSRKPSAPEQ